MRKRLKVVASIIAAPSSTQGVPQVEIAHHRCTHCSNVFAANADIKPFCPDCGSESEKADAGEYQSDDVMGAPDTELSSLTCASCNNSMIMLNTREATFAGFIHCTACGEELKYEPVEESAEDNQLTPQELDVQADANDAPSDEELEDMLKKGDYYEKDHASTDEGDENVEDQPAVADLAVEPQGDVEVVDEAEQAESQESVKDEGLGGESVVESAEEELLDLIDNEEEAAIERVGEGVSSVIVAVVGGVPVAHKANTNQQASFAEPRYINAMRSTLANRGIRETISKFDMTPIMVRVDTAKWKANEVAKAVEEAKVVQTASVLQDKETLRQSLSIAAVGLNKSFFRNHTHALKAAMFDTLVAAGFKNPASVIDTAFANACDAYNRTLVDLAFDIASKPTDVRNSLAETIDVANYLKVQADADVEDEEMMDEEEGRADELEATLSKPVTARVENNAGPQLKVVGGVQYQRGKLF